MKNVNKKRWQDFQKYVATYDLKKNGCGGRESVVIDDVLYGLGLAIGGKENEYGDGYKKFKRELYDKLRAEFQ
jgi:hypothetical protein